MDRLLTSLGLLAALALAAPTFAQSVVTEPVGFQGRLAKPDGTPVADGNYQITFSIYSAATGGTLLWQQVSPVVPVRNGAFAAKLDFSVGFQNGNTLDSAFRLAAPYLEIKIGNDAPLSPRQKFTNIVYSLFANTANTVPNGSIGLSQLESGLLNFANFSGQITGDQIANGTITAANLSAVFGPSIGNFSGGNYLVSTIKTDTSPNYVAAASISGKNYAFVVNYGNSALSVYNVTTPAAPVRVSTTVTGANPTVVAIATIGGTPYAFTSNSGANTVGVYNVANPAVPVLVKTLTTGIAPDGLAVGANGASAYLYVVNTSSNLLQLFNVTTPGTAAFAGSVATGNAPQNVLVSGTTAYITNSGDNSIQVVNAANPAAPVVTSATTGAAGAYGLALNGATLAVTCPNDNTVRFYNVAAAPVLIGAVSVGTLPVYITNRGATAYVGCYLSGEVDVIDFSGTPRITGIFSALNGANGVAYSGGYLYVTEYYNNTLAILNPTSITSAYASSLAVASDFSVGGTLHADSSGRGRGTPSYGLTFGAGNTGEGIGSNRADSSAANYDGLDFYTNFTKRLSIASSGNVGIGTTNPAAALDVNGAGNFNGGVTGATTNSIAAGVEGDDNGGGVSGYGVLGRSIVGSGVAGVSSFGYGVYGSSSNGYAGYFSGNVKITNTLTVNATTYTSDARYKTNVATLNNALEDVLSLRGVSYDWDRAKWPAKNFSDTRQIGFIAQDLEKIFPELVQTDKEGYKSVNYIGVVPVAVEAIKTLNAKVDAQQKQIDELKAQLNGLDALKKQVAALVRQMQDAKNK